MIYKLVSLLKHIFLKCKSNQIHMPINSPGSSKLTRMQKHISLTHTYHTHTFVSHMHSSHICSFHTHLPHTHTHHTHSSHPHTCLAYALISHAHSSLTHTHTHTYTPFLANHISFIFVPICSKTLAEQPVCARG